MKKITLMDIMESLSNDDIQTAQNDIHEWFVEKGKEIQTNITGLSEGLKEEPENQEIEISESDDSNEEDITETEEDFAELNEDFDGMDSVSSTHQDQEGHLVGHDTKIPVYTKAALPSHKGKDRVAGTPVEVTGKQHTGFDREKAPAVADVKIKKTVQNAKAEPTKVGDNKSALLNKVDGTINTKSPLANKSKK